MILRLLIVVLFVTMPAFSQTPPIEPGVSMELAKWRAARYSDVRYKLNLTLEKMSPVLKGTVEVRVKVGTRTLLSATPQSGVIAPPIILDWRKIKGFEDRSTISNVSLNGQPVKIFSPDEPAIADRSVRVPFEESNEHLIFRDGVVIGENVIKLDFTSPILTSGSAITRYVDKEDGAEYIYSLFVPSDASTAFPVFDQPDLKARFQLHISTPYGWNAISNGRPKHFFTGDGDIAGVTFEETQPISTYVFAFAAGPFEAFGDTGGNLSGSEGAGGASGAQPQGTLPTGRVSASNIYVRKSQAAKFRLHAAEVFRLNREGIKYLETYFDYKFPFPKYDLVLIPEFPFGGMEHAGATFLREDRVIFPTEPTKNDYITRANLIFHEAAHQWFGDTVTMKWFDDLWLKEGFAEFMAYKTLEKVMPEYNAWKIFYERNKQAAYLTDSTKGTTPIYQEIANLNAAKSAYGNIVYRKAPSFLKQAEFYIGPDKFQTAVRAFLKKHEFGNAGWEDLVNEFEAASGQYLKEWAFLWVKQPGVPKMIVGSEVNSSQIGLYYTSFEMRQPFFPGVNDPWRQKIKIMMLPPNDKTKVVHEVGFGNHTDTGGDSRGYFGKTFLSVQPLDHHWQIGRISRPAKDFVPSYPGSQILTSRKFPLFIFPNYQDYGYGIFLLDDKSRDYVLKNIQNEKDDFLRTMMWGSLWDSVREGELDPKEYVEMVVKNLSQGESVKASNSELPSLEKEGWPRFADGVVRSSPADASRTGKETTTPSAAAAATPPLKGGEQDESTIQTLLGRVSTAMTYYLSDGQRSELAPRVEAVLIDRMQNAATIGQRITFYRAFLNIASTENARSVLKRLLKSVPPAVAGGASNTDAKTPPATAGGTDPHTQLPLKTKDRFDIVTKLLVLGDPDASALLAALEKAETSDEAKRYAYAATAGIATAENKAKFWSDFTTNKEISESWIEAAFGPFNSPRHAEMTLPFLDKALAELPNLKRNRKIFFVNGWLGAFIGGQKSDQALAVVNKFLVDNPNLDKDLRLKILENVDLIERAVKIRAKSQNRER